MEKFYFDFDNLKVYQKALAFVSEAFRLVAIIPNAFRFSLGDNLFEPPFLSPIILPKEMIKNPEKNERDFFNTRLTLLENAHQY